jgi:hypothetical protein
MGSWTISTEDINKVIHKIFGLPAKPNQINNLGAFQPKHLSKTPQLTA